MEHDTSPPTSGRSLSSEIPLHYDVVLVVFSFLEASDVCALGSCSRSWRGICASDGVWTELYLRRWPSAAAADFAAASTSQDIRTLYINKHREMAGAASSIIKLVEQWSQTGSLEVGYYLRAISDLRFMQLSFKDIQLFFLGTEHNVLLNLIGLHYCLFWLDVQVGIFLLFIFYSFAKSLRSLQSADLLVGFNHAIFAVLKILFCLFFYILSLLRNHRIYSSISAVNSSSPSSLPKGSGLVLELASDENKPNDLMEVLVTLHLSERQVCVSWFKVGRWFYGFRLPDEHRSRTLSLGDLTMAKEEEVFCVLNRGVIHEVLRVHIKRVARSSHWG